MDVKAIGDNIKARRNKLGLSQDDLAGASNVARGAIQTLELGRGNPTIGTLEAIAKSLKCEVRDLLSPKERVAHAMAKQSSPPQFDLGWAEAAQILHAISVAEPLRRLAGLYILTKNENYLAQIRALPQGERFAQVLKKVL